MSKRFCKTVLALIAFSPALASALPIRFDVDEVQFASDNMSNYIIGWASNFSDFDFILTNPGDTYTRSTRYAADVREDSDFSGDRSGTVNFRIGLETPTGADLLTVNMVGDVFIDSRLGDDLFTLTWTPTVTPLDAFGFAGYALVSTLENLSETFGDVSGGNYRRFLGGATFALTGPSQSVPAPETLALFGLGLAGLGYSRRKKA